MSEAPLISVVIPCYNREAYISKAIESVINQSYQNWECIIVDDGSTDKSASIIKELSLKCSKIRYIFQENQERCIARNNGIKKSLGHYIAFLDSDDYWMPNHLSDFIEFTKSLDNKIALYFSKVYYQENNKRWLKKDSELKIEKLFDFILTETFNTSRIIIHKKILNELSFDPMLPGVEDLDLTLRIATKYPIIQMQHASVVYCLYDENYSYGDINRFEKELKYFKIIQRKKELKKRLPIKHIKRLKSMCYFHIGLKSFENGKKNSCLSNLFLAFCLCPRGYNQKNNKILFVHFLYSIPILGVLFQKLNKLTN